jgi:predicted enzyme related to lactoylglutathione lyase
VAANTTNIAGFELTVRDLGRAVDFYTRGLGLSVRAREEHDEFQEVQLTGEGDSAALLLVSPRKPVAVAAILPDLIKVALLTDDVPSRFDEALKAGGQSAQAPQHYEPLDVWYANVRDPDGYTVQLIQRRQPTEASPVVATSAVDE